MRTKLFSKTGIGVIVLIIITGVILFFASGCGGGGSSAGTVLTSNKDAQPNISVSMSPTSDNNEFESPVTFSLQTSASSNYVSEGDVECYARFRGQTTKVQNCSDSSVTFTETFEANSTNERETLYVIAEDVGGTGVNVWKQDVIITPKTTNPSVSTPELESFSCSPETVEAGKTVTCAGAVADPGDSGSNCIVTFGDGTSLGTDQCNYANIAHKYTTSREEPYTVTLYLVKNEVSGNALTDEVKVNASSSPPPEHPTLGAPSYTEKTAGDSSDLKIVDTIFNGDDDPDLEGAADTACETMWVTNPNGNEDEVNLSSNFAWEYEVSLDQQGWQTFEFNCKDSADTYSNTLEVELKVDTRAPTKPSISGWTTPYEEENATLTIRIPYDCNLEITDEENDVTKTWNQVNDDVSNQFTNISYPISFSDEGTTYEFTALCTDKAENESDEVTIAILYQGEDTGGDDDEDDDEEEGDDDNPEPEYFSRFSTDNPTHVAFYRNNEFYILEDGDLQRRTTGGSDKGHWNLNSTDIDNLPTISSPSGIAYCNDKLYISNLDNERVYVISVFDPSNPEFLTTMGGDISLDDPKGIVCTGSGGSIYVADYGNDRIAKFSESDRSYQSSFTADDSEPIDVAFNNDVIYVLEKDGDVLNAYNTSGSLQDSYTSISDATALDATDATDTNETLIAVADRGNGEIKGILYDEDEEMVLIWDIDSTSAGDVDNPYGIGFTTASTWRLLVSNTDPEYNYVFEEN